METIPRSKNSFGFPDHVSMPEGLDIRRVDLSNMNMRKAFEHAMKHQKMQEKSGMRAVTSSLVTKNGSTIMGVAGELTNIIDGFDDKLADDNTWHAEHGRCDRMQSNGNVDYDKCPGCRHDRHSERSAIRKAQRDEIDLTDSEIYLYGQWWVCEPCAQAAYDAGVRTIYLLTNARELFDRAQDGQADRLKAFQEKYSTQ